jgi:hypothetical protein
MIDNILSRETQCVALLVAGLVSMALGNYAWSAIDMGLAGLWYWVIQNRPEGPLTPAFVALRIGVLVSTATHVVTALWQG